MRKSLPCLRQWKNRSSPSLSRRSLKTNLWGSITQDIATTPPNPSEELGEFHNLDGTEKPPQSSPSRLQNEEPKEFTSPPISEPPLVLSTNPTFTTKTATRKLDRVLKPLHDELQNSSTPVTSEAPNGLSDSPLPQLPLSPLMDPKLILARKRHRMPKPLPTYLSPIESKLSKSPYARALATPVRCCHLTGARLPSFFLLKYGIAMHPKTGNPWHLPRASDYSRPKRKEDNPPSNESVTPNKAITQTEEKNNPPPSPSEELLPSTPISIPTRIPTSPPPDLSTRTASASYYHSSHTSLKLLTSLPRKKYLGTIPQRWLNDPTLEINKLVWRQDMPTFTLNLMRERACAALERLARSYGGYIVAFDSVEQVLKSRQVGAALWMGEANTEPAAEGNQSSDPHISPPPQVKNNSPSPIPPPPFYATLTYHAHYIPFYNLPSLLGVDRVQRLWAAKRQFQGPVVVVKKRNNTVYALMQLWGLMGYLAPGEGREERRD